MNAEKLDVDAVRAQFPILHKPVNGKPLVFLDSAATSLKPQRVVDTISQFYAEEYATVRRGVYALSQAATTRYEGVRAQAAQFLGAAEADEIVFVRGVTEAMNLLAYSYGRSVLEAGDEVLVTEMEHHANIVPWQLVCKEKGATLKVASFDDSGQLNLEEIRELITDRTKIVSLVHVSNALGTINPVAAITRMAHEMGAVAIVDGAQSTPHIPLNVQSLGADFFACSAHKLFGPTGVGLLYGRKELLSEMPPWMGGGEMIDKVTFEESTYDDPPHRFEAGTPPIAQVMGLGAALEWIEELGRPAIAAHEHALLRYATKAIKELPGVSVVGTAPLKAGILAFTLDGIHPFDIGTLLDEQGIAIRVGHHCAQPVMQHYDVPATARASFGPYNHEGDIDALIDGLKTV
ncbi:MAG: cysteine desulfurase, partial [Myxococcota bacterium]